MTGTLVNAAAIAAGGCVGLLLKKGVKGSHQDSINKALGVAVLVLGLNGVISSMFTVNADGTLASSGELLLIISLVLGTLAMTVLMCILNLVLDPIFWGTPREAVLRLLVPAIIPFNLSKAGINSLITFLIYKRVSKLIHRAEDRSR